MQAISFSFFPHRHLSLPQPVVLIKPKSFIPLHNRQSIFNVSPQPFFCLQFESDAVSQPYTSFFLLLSN